MFHTDYGLVQYKAIGSFDCPNYWYNLLGKVTLAQNIASCEAECNKHSDCVGFLAYVSEHVWGDQKCYLKRAPCFEWLKPGHSDWKIYKKR